MKTITRIQREKVITFERKEKPINYDIKRQIRLSKEQYEKVLQKIKQDDQVKDFSSLIRTLLEQYLKNKH